MTEEQVRVEEFELSGDEVVATIKALLHEGNIRRISLQTEEGKTLIEVPLLVWPGLQPGSWWLRCGPPLARLLLRLQI
jgi:hypothetical protein